MKSVCASRTRVCILDALWVLFYLMCAFIVFANVVIWPDFADWLVAATFVASLASVIFHVIRASLTRSVMSVRLIVGCNVAVMAAAALAKDRLSAQASAAIVASVPLLSYFTLCGWWLASAPPRPGEAMRPDMTLRECHILNKLSVILVLVVEFVQFNALSFNPALNAWRDLRALSAYFTFSFFVVTSSEESFENQLWVFFSLAIGWVLFALVALSIIAHSRAVDGREPAYAEGSLAPMGDARHRMHEQLGRHVAQQQGGRPLASALQTETSGLNADDTMSSPVILVMRTIGCSGVRVLRTHGALLIKGRTKAEHAMRALVHLQGPFLGGLFALLLVPFLVFFVFLAIMLSFMLTGVVMMYCAIGIAMCCAFAAIALLHFPILMNMLSVLNCEYDLDGNNGYMKRMPSQPCWEGRHWLFAGASVVTVALLYPVMIHFERKRQSAAEVSYHVRFTSCLLIGKLALSACSALLVSTLSPAAYLLCCMAMLVFFLHINNQREQDNQPACCNVNTVRRLRSLLLTCALWTASTTLASTVLDVDDWPLLASLGVLWLSTAAFYVTIIFYPQREPTYQSEAPSIDVFKAPSVALSSLPSSGWHARNAAASKKSDPETGSIASTEVAGDAITLPHVELQDATAPASWAGGLAREQGQHMPCSRSQFSAAANPSLRSGGSSFNSKPASALAKIDHMHHVGDRSSSNLSSVADGIPSSRTIYLPAQPSARPRIAFYQSDDGFDLTPALFSAGLGADAHVEHLPEIVPIVLTSQPPIGGVSNGGGAFLGAGSLLGSSTEDVLCAGDVIIGVNGTYGLSALDVACILDDSQEPLRLTVRRGTLRKDGTKSSRATRNSQHYTTKEVANCMLLYPQDGELQRAACERLTRSVISASQGAILKEFHEEVRSAVLLPVVINAMEVHWKSAPVVTAASRLLCCLANTEGHLRANVVAAGALPAMCVALGKHAGSEAVHALCDLASEICSPRGSPSGSRRSMCEALAATGTMKAVLTAFRGHVSHQGIVAATCKVLLAYHEEFSANGPLPSQLTKALRSSDTLAALDEAQHRFTRSQKIQLGAEWATGVGRAAACRADRAEAKLHGASPRSTQRGESRLTPHGSPRRALQPIQPLSMRSMKINEDDGENERDWSGERGRRLSADL